METQPQSQPELQQQYQKQYDNSSFSREDDNTPVITLTNNRSLFSGIISFIIVCLVFLILLSVISMGWCFGKDLYKETLGKLF